MSTGPKDRKLLRKAGAASEPDDVSDEADEDVPDDAADDVFDVFDALDALDETDDVFDEDDAADDASPDSSPQDAKAQTAVSSSTIVSSNTKILFIAKTTFFCIFFLYAIIHPFGGFVKSRKRFALDKFVPIRYTMGKETKGCACQMDRTCKVKIALGVTVALLALRVILGFFPADIEFAPFDDGAPVGELQSLEAVGITYCMTYAPTGYKPLNFYRVQLADGGEALLVDTTAYYDESFAEPVLFTGTTARPLGGEPEQLLPYCTFAESELSRFDGDAQTVLRGLSGVTVLDLTFRDRTRPTVASFVVSALAMVSFCVFLAMLLKEYFGGKRRKAKGET